jgi:TPP-dependent trihydroxycyclohexane-1,2-dione (THcHDO) dehydratase
MFRTLNVRLVNIDVCTFDAFREGAIPVVGDARVTLGELSERLSGWLVSAGYRQQMTALAHDSRTEVQRLIAPDPDAGMLGQEEVIGIVNELSGPQDVVVNAAGSMPGDLHRLWKVGSQRFECNRNLRGKDGKQPGPLLPVDFAEPIEAYGLPCATVETSIDANKRFGKKRDQELLYL